MPRRPDPISSALPGDKTVTLTFRVGLVLVGLMVALMVGKGIRVASLPVDQMVSWNVVIDDGYYYFQVARNLARGHGSTFDRVNRTNGYQPLWTALLVPVYWFTDDPGRGMRGALVLAVVLAGLALPLMFVGLRRLAGVGGALLFCGLVVANPFFLRIVQGGLETPVLFVTMAGVVALWALRGEQVLRGQRRACLGFGLLLALTTMARVDVALILAPLALLVVLWGRGWRRRALWIALPGALVVGPYVLWNWVTQGSPVPVSGQVKAWVAATYTPTWDLFRATEQWRGVTRMVHELTWPWNGTRREPLLAELGSRSLPFLLAGALLLLRLLWSARARRNRLALILLAGSGVGVVLHGLYMFFVYRSCGHWNYHYFFPLAVVCCVALALSVTLLAADLGLLLDRLVVRGRLRRGYAALSAALCLPLLGLLALHGVPAAAKYEAELRRPPRESFRHCRLEAACDMARNYPHDTVFGAWWAGTLGYFSDRRVVNLDGVINSEAFFRRYLQTDTVDRYIRQGPITNLVDFFWRDPLHPLSTPASRAFFWEHDKEHIIARLRPHLRLVHRVPFRGASGMYIIDVMKPR